MASLRDGGAREAEVRIPRLSRRRIRERPSKTSATRANQRSITSAAAAAITAAATAAAIAAATAAATATTATTTAVTAATTATIFTRLGFIYGETPTVVFLVMQPFDGCLRLRFGVHFHKAETLAATRRAILNDLSALHGSELREQLLQSGVADPVGQIPNVQLLAHR
jgi:hypothetical protein